MDAVVELDGVSTMVALATFSGSIGCLLLCVYAWGQRTIAGQREFSLLCLSVSIWCGFATAEYLSMEESRRLMFGALTHLGSNFTPLAWLLFTIRFSQAHSFKLRRWLIALLLLPPVTNLGLLATNDMHNLVWAQASFQLVQGIPDLNIVHGPWFRQFFMPIMYGYWILGTLILMGSLTQSESRQFRGQVLMLLLCASLIFFFNLLYMVAGFNIYGMDPTPIVILIGPFMIFLTTNRTQFLQGPEISYRSVFMDATEPVILIDNQGRIMDLNPAARMHSRVESPLGSRMLDVFPDCPPRLIQPGNYSSRQEVNRADNQGHEEYRSMALRSTHGSVIGRQVLIRDVTEHREHTSYLLDLANRDPLTNLLNRRGFFTELDRRTLDQHFFTLVFVDLNDFKRVNDEYGHRTGDQVLIEVGRRLKEALVGGGVVGRIGGDEFALILDRESRATGLRLCERIEQAMDKPIAVDLHSLNVSASIGLACFPEDGDDSESLMSNADKRMYWIKRQRRSSRSRI